MTEWFESLTEEQRSDVDYDEIENALLHVEKLSIVARKVRDMINKSVEEAEHLSKEYNIPIIIPDFFASDRLIKNSDFDWSESSIYC